MSVESLMFFVLVLVIWGISSMARWLQEQQGSSSGTQIEPGHASSSHEFEATPSAETFMPHGALPQPSHATANRNTIVRQQKLISQLRMGRPQTLRQGIILMTVLGPCRAYAPPNG